MDPFIVDYLRSGRAWLLVGSGPSNAMGYPTWATMSRASHALARSEGGRTDLAKIDAAAAASKFPAVFEKSARVVGLSRLIQHLRSMFPSTGNGKVYEDLARWPVPVYLTTNFEHEISKHLTAIGESYQALFKLRRSSEPASSRYLWCDRPPPWRSPQRDRPDPYTISVSRDRRG